MEPLGRQYALYNPSPQKVVRPPTTPTSFSGGSWIYAVKKMDWSSLRASCSWMCSWLLESVSRWISLFLRACLPRACLREVLDENSGSGVAVFSIVVSTQTRHTHRLHVCHIYAYIGVVWGVNVGRHIWHTWSVWDMTGT